MKYSDIREHLGKFRVGIAGAGGLGSNCAAALARSGVGTVVISDFDIVEELNLDRQYYFADQTGMYKTLALKENIRKINPRINVISHEVSLTPENIPVIYAGCDVIIEAFDEASMKQMLIETVQLALPGIPLIVGSGMAGWGNNDTLRSRKIDDLLYVCGDESTQVSDDLPPLAPRVGIVANMQANLALEILLERKK